MILALLVIIRPRSIFGPDGKGVLASIERDREVKLREAAMAPGYELRAGSMP
ncbi:hypothetical protein [Nisaea sp.]|uniref:hypothetical protein n=1 Tax=Nisaea sp. TaxID=2024842 RepID=UPI003B5276CC